MDSKLEATSDSSDPRPRVVIVGGGLAGLAAAVALSQFDLQVELFEARRRLGGRAGSFTDPATGDWIDHCQHVSMGCCTNFADFCRRTKIAHLFRRFRRLHFYSPDGRRSDVCASRWLPAPFHLGPSLLRLNFLSWSERIRVARALWKLARTRGGGTEGLTIGEWLRHQGQTDRAMRRFWSVILVSALAETVERASFAAARKVFIDGFLASRHGYEVEVPCVPLNEIYECLAGWLRDRGALIRSSARVRYVAGDATRVTGVQREDGTHCPCDSLIVAIPWRQLPDVLPNEVSAALPGLDAVQRLEPSPISSLHLWFDRPVSCLPHAVFIDRLCQWVFRRDPQEPGQNGPAEHYYQVVISASRDLVGRERSEVVDEVLADLSAIWPDVSSARLLRWRLLTQPEAVFSPRPGVDQYRPPQQSPVPNLFFAGDWTRTGWPATMEGAVRSGYLAAEGVLRRFGIHAHLVQPERRSWWVHWLTG